MNYAVPGWFDLLMFSFACSVGILCWYLNRFFEAMFDPGQLLSLYVRLLKGVCSAWVV